MSYGIDKPSGLVATKNMGAATSNGQSFTWPIKNGYAQNIFNGDAVCIVDGFLRNFGDVTNPGGATIVGVFNGCSYVQPNAANPTDPANPGRKYWPAGTALVGDGAYAIGYVLDDPNVIYEIQADANGIAWNNIMKNADLVYTYDGGGLIVGDTTTGTSSVRLNGNVNTTATSNCAIRGFVNNGINPTPVPTLANLGTKVPFVNVEVLLQNPRWAARNAAT